MKSRTRRRRWLRDENVAPWATLVVVLLLWWIGVRLFGPAEINGTSVTAVAPPAPHGALPPDKPAAMAAPQQPQPQPQPPQPETIAPVTREEVTALRQRDLLVPVKDISLDALHSDYDDARGSRKHEAIDIMAPRGTAVRATDDGRIAKLFTSERGGLTIYQFDEDGRFCFYYAHLDRYAPGLLEGAEVERGDIIGYVGSTGNAAPNAPHLHFAIFKLGPDKRWWQGAPIDPYLVLR